METTHPLTVERAVCLARLTPSAGASRSELGKIQLDNVFRERESLNIAIVESINKASECWGITCLRYEIREWDDTAAMSGPEHC